MSLGLPELLLNLMLFALFVALVVWVIKRVTRSSSSARVQELEARVKKLEQRK